MSSLCAIAAWLECFQEKPSWCLNEQVCQGRISVKRFERSNGLDTALYKNIPLPFFYLLGELPMGRIFVSLLKLSVQHNLLQLKENTAMCLSKTV